MTTQTDISWIAADWGTTNLRVWALSDTGEILIHRGSDRGMGKLAPAEFEPALLDLIEDILPTRGEVPIMVCGMAGSRQGWAEAPYKSVPCPPPSIADATRVKTADPRLDVHILPGLKQLKPADVMRGEETQIAGFLADQPGFSGTLCLPGTHTKWVKLKSGVVERFRTCMTGETFALYRHRSVLRHGLSESEFDTGAFKNAVLCVLQDPKVFASELFGIRAASLVAGQTPAEATGRLSGLLIGAELASIRDEFDLADVAILGSSKIAGTYHAALECLGQDARLLDAESITLRGLTLAFSCYARETS